MSSDDSSQMTISVNDSKLNLTDATNYREPESAPTINKIKNTSSPVEHKEPRDYLGFSKLTLITGLQLLSDCMVPIMIGIFTLIMMRNNQDVGEQNRLNDLDIARQQRLADKQHSYMLGNESVFGQYLKNIVDILQATGRGYVPNSLIIRGFTLTALRQLSLNKKRSVVDYLYELGLTDHGEPAYRVHFKDAPLDNVDFSSSIFVKASFVKTFLINSSFIKANLKDVHFTASLMIGANFSGSRLNRSVFYKTNLQYADLTDTTLTDVTLNKANLTGALLNDEQLSQAVFMTDTIFPNGTIGQDKNLVINGNAEQGLSNWNITGDIAVHTDLSSKLTYFVGRNNASISQRVNVTRYQRVIKKNQYCISLYYINNITIFIRYSSNTNYYVHKYIITPLNGTQVPTLDHYFWSRCYENIQVSPSFMDIDIYFTTLTLNSNSSSMCRDIKFFISYVPDDLQYLYINLD